MSTLLRCACLAFLASAPNLCYALELIEIVTKERAAELGLVVRAHAAGPDAIQIELEFPAAGELKDYSSVALEIREGKKLLLSLALREEPAKPGMVAVGFAVDRARLPQLTLKVVTRAQDGRIGHVLRMNEFVDLANLH
ncbi:MAG TPA: hypothetical protein VFB80_06645 [Pirellulaceae bacterium]|nr:hypothetical protein [Pirellulaceae bacterium]